MVKPAFKPHTKVVVLADPRYRSNRPGDCATKMDAPRLQEQIGAILLRRAVERLNRFIQPDLVIILGNLVTASGDVIQATNDLRELRDILQRLTCPYLVIRGKDDPDPRVFHSILPEPSPMSEIAGIRVLCSSDNEARRLARHDDFSNPIVFIQNITNPAQTSTTASGRPQMALRVSSRRYPSDGIPSTSHARHHLIAESVSEAPYTYHVATFDAMGNVECQHQTLAMPKSLGFIDLHSHTQMAYCAGDVRADWSAYVARAMGLHAIAFTEHSGHLYFNQRDFNSGACCRGGIASANCDNERIDDYIRIVREIESPIPVLLGMEIDTDFTGAPVIHRNHRAALEWAVGAVHFIPPAARDNQADFIAAFQQLTQGLCTSGSIDVLAHPFRIFRREKREVPPELYPWLVRLLKRTGVAAEINFHTNEPHPTFVRMCLESGIKLTFGSDAHDLWEVGEFFGHLQLLAGLGVASKDVNNFLTQPSHARTPGGTTI